MGCFVIWSRRTTGIVWFFAAVLFVRAGRGKWRCADVGVEWDNRRYCLRCSFVYTLLALATHANNTAKGAAIVFCTITLSSSGSIIPFVSYPSIVTCQFIICVHSQRIVPLSSAIVRAFLPSFSPSISIILLVQFLPPPAWFFFCSHLWWEVGACELDIFFVISLCYLQIRLRLTPRYHS